MIRLLKFLVFVCVIGFIGLVGYAYLGDLTPEREELRIPVDLNEN
ncbi:MAG: hypothetical protein AAGH83_06935 [Pseudomonadota bacterium]